MQARNSSCVGPPAVSATTAITAHTIQMQIAATLLPALCPGTGSARGVSGGLGTGGAGAGAEMTGYCVARPGVPPAASRLAPHPVQNRASGELLTWHAMQMRGSGASPLPQF
jgi:hypothetical protein